MNLYIRYFDHEVLVTNVEQALDFLTNETDINVDDFLATDITNYANGLVPYPKRYRVRGKNYFIVIKTQAETLEEFKAAASQSRNAKENNQQRKEEEEAVLQAYRPGWYSASIFFRRVVQMPKDGKCRYFDTDFRVRLKATSIQDCYNRICDHLHNRFDVDTRSQLPSIKGHNFTCQYLGMK